MIFLGTEVSYTMKNGLVTASAYSLRILGCISWSPINLWTFRFLRWLWIWSLLTVGSSLFLQLVSSLAPIWEAWESDIKNWDINLLSTSAFSSSVVTRFAALLMRQLGLLWVFWLTYLKKLIPELTLNFFCVPCKAQFHLCYGLLHPIPTQPYFISILVPDHHPRFNCLWDRRAFFPLVWPADPTQTCQCLAFPTWFLAPGNYYILLSVEK